MESYGCVRNIVTYTTLIHGVCKSKRVDDGKPNVAQEVFNQMGSHNALPDIRTYNVLLDGLCYNGKPFLQGNEA
ncbi:unnamed protein product [Eruca vesicaria subsp. sativa]|uniref:Pentatricopeptide repeat-containing protein n=1 Tax=Eruca vesicaria subsp. sativa TaxID=29727 RepID=A0ABC8L802_ERUVS|nr:unnamed protein product [Eruca vesicaria subsp. sativa]